jgi:hypothetical protein
MKKLAKKFISSRMGQCLIAAEDINTNQCSYNINQTLVYATCRRCNQHLQFVADPHKYKNPECQCFSNNVQRTNNPDEWKCNYCKKLFIFKNDDEMNCKCGATDWDYFYY